MGVALTSNKIEPYCMFTGAVRFNICGLWLLAMLANIEGH